VHHVLHLFTEGDRDAMPRRRRSEGVQPNPPAGRQDSPVSDIDGGSPLTPEETQIPLKARQSDSEDDDDASADLDPKILAEIQARYMTAQALGESDKLPFLPNDTVEAPCHIVVECRLDSIQEGKMTMRESKEWRKKRVFEAPRVRTCRISHPATAT